MIPSDEALEVMDGMVEMQVIDVSSAASSSDLLDALDIKDLAGFSDWLRELIDGDFVRKRRPRSIRESTGYYVNVSQLERLMKQLDPDGEIEPANPKTDWGEIRAEIGSLENVLEKSDLGQTDRAQAGAILSSLRILVEAPEPPKKAIRNLLYDLAAIATLFSLALQIAASIH